MLVANKKISIIIADDNTFFRLGFKLALKKQKEINVVAEASNGTDLYRLVEIHQPDIVITDISIQGLNGHNVCQMIKNDFPGTEIIVLSLHDEENNVETMLQSGARAYLLKYTSIEEITEAIRTVYRGNYYYSGVTKNFFNFIFKNKTAAKPHPTVSFTNREMQIIQLICKEFTSKEIAVQLGVCERTIEDHRNHIQKKMGARNMIGIAIYAIRNKMFIVGS
ncbi:MAG TPA: response regulator transcription factor [Flavisolibacter sp.]